MQYQNLTGRQEAFCKAYIETGNATKAYRLAGYSTKASAKSINEAACKLLKNAKVIPRLAELRAPAIERHNITVDSLVIELEAARIAALGAETPQASAAVSATMAKAKLLGYDQKQAAVEDNPLLALLAQIQGLAPLRVVSGEVIDNEDDQY